MNQSVPAPTRRLKVIAALARWLLTALVAAWLLFAIALGVLHGWIVPRIDQYRPHLEAEASRVMGVPVRIGAISADPASAGLFPAFELLDVVLQDAEGRTALRLPRVVVSASPRSLLGLRFEQLYIDGPELDVRRAPDGHITVGGLDFSQNRGEGTDAQDWFFSQPEFVIRNGTLRWTDEQRGAPPLALDKVDLVVRNESRRHELRLDATPPAAWGDRFMLVGKLRQPLLSRRNGEWQNWDGQLHAELPRVDVSELRRYADVGADIREGLGALRVWADVVKGAVEGATADVALTEVDVKLATDLEPLALRSVSGRLGGQRLDGGFEFSTTGLAFETGDGLVWPGGNVFVRYTAPANAQPAGEFRADQLDLNALARIGNRLPLGAATHEALQAYAPRGLVRSVHATWSGPLDALTRYQAKGVVEGLAVAARRDAHTPGLSGATIDFDLTQAGGKARVAMKDGAFDLPGVFEDPLVPVDTLAANAEWKKDGDRLSVQVSGLQFANADAQGQAQFNWHTSDAATGPSRSRFPGVLDLTGAFSRADGTRVHRYLPEHIPADVRHYVRDAVTQGTAADVKFRVKGDLSEMPFNNPARGEFRIAGPVRNVTFDYVPKIVQPKDSLPWPALVNLSGELIFDRAGMEVKGATARLGSASGLQVVRADARIPDLAHESTVHVTGQIRGALGDALKVVASSPLNAMTGQALGRATATGNADVQLDLTLPLHAINTSRVAGSVVLRDNDVQFTPDTPVLARARGNVGFNDSGFTLTGGQARMFGGDMRIEGGSRTAAGETQVSLRVQGTATADGLRQARELGFLSRIAQQASGSAAYTASIGFRRGQTELSIASNLQGLALDLPAPIGKTADAVLPLKFETALVPASLVAGPLQDQLSLELGKLASVTYVRDVSGPQARVIRGAIGVGLAPGESAPLPEETGVIANVNLGRADIDAWEAALSRTAGASMGQPAPASAAGSAAGSTAGPTSPTASTAADAAATQSYLPTRMAVRATELTVEGRTLHNVVLGGAREGLNWRANIDARELGGYVEYRQPSGGGPVAGGRLYARLARVSIAQSQAGEVEAILEQPPEMLPALDIVVEDFELRGKRLGRVEIEAVNRGSAGSREWRLSKLNVTSPEAIFTATGNWAALGAQAAGDRSARPGAAAVATPRRTVMNFKLEISNAGELLARHGMKGVVRRGKGRMEGQVAWLGSPISVDYPSMNGQFIVNVEDGQFLKADPGLAKLLGVLSLQSLPRRLTLDFRDVFSEGFAFDFVRGDVKIEQGIASTNNLQMKGVNAAVLMEGSASLADETQNLRVMVVPEINAGTASLVLTAINPAIGLGSFLAQYFLRRPLAQATTQEFQIDGTWADPRIARVRRNAQGEVTVVREEGTGERGGVVRQ